MFILCENIIIIYCCNELKLYLNFITFNNFKFDYDFIQKQGTWSCRTDGGSSAPHASGGAPTALWRAAGPFCPEIKRQDCKAKNLKKKVKITGKRTRATHKNHGNVGEALVRLTDVRQPRVVQENLLEDEGGDLKDKRDPHC